MRTTNNNNSNYIIIIIIITLSGAFLTAHWTLEGLNLKDFFFQKWEESNNKRLLQQDTEDNKSHTKHVAKSSSQEPASINCERDSTEVFKIKEKE